MYIQFCFFQWGIALCVGGEKAIQIRKDNSLTVMRVSYDNISLLFIDEYLFSCFPQYLSAGFGDQAYFHQLK